MKIFFIIFISLVLISCSRGEIQTALCNATEDKSMIECLEIIEHEKRTKNNLLRTGNQSFRLTIT